MAKKGSITLFLALILSLILSLVCTSIESVRMAAARTQILSSLDIGLYSLFGQYDRELLEDYDLFFLNASGDSGNLNLSAVYDNMESYMKPLLRQNSQKLTVIQGGFTGYRLATDEDGEVFYRQAVKYVRDTLGSRGVEMLLDKFQEKREQVGRAEKAGKQAEEGNTLENYDAEMNEAAKNSEEAARQKSEAAEDDFSGGEVPAEDSFSDGSADTQVVNPIPVLKRIRKMGLLDLVVPAEKGISENQVRKEELLSGRKIQQGMTMPGDIKKDSSYTSRLLFQQYLTDKLGNYMEPAAGGLRYQMEYILSGKNSDRENLKAVAGRLLLVREGVNAACLMADPGKRAQIQGLALAIAAGFLIPPAAVIIEAALLLCWSFAESILDLRELLHGGKVPLIKDSADWQISLENLPNLLEGLDSQRRSSDDGVSYEDYLQILLLTQSKEEKLERGMDMVELSVRKSAGREGFRLDHCMEAAEISVDVKANGRNTYTVTKQYSYT